MLLIPNYVTFQIRTDRLLSNLKKIKIFSVSIFCSALSTFKISTYKLSSYKLNTYKLLGTISSAVFLVLSANASAFFYKSTPLDDSSIAKSNKPKVAIAIHGGAGTILQKNMTSETEAAYINVLTQAINKGYQQLVLGNDGTLAVISAIQHMENSPLFNAGIGAVYTFDEIHELDASIMHGKTKQAGAVAGITTIKNPILAALTVMQKSDHVILTAKGAETFSMLHGLETVDNSYFNTTRRFDALQKAKKRIIEASSNSNYKFDSPQDLLAFQDYKFGTVGAVVLDANGNLVAGTSTGGMTAKRYGRIGDSPIIGAGTYADNESCAVSATGHGEYFIRHNVASDICARVKYQGVSLDQAANTVLFDVLNSEAGSGGVIAVDSKGNIAMPFNTPGMYRASIDTEGKLTVSIYKD